MADAAHRLIRSQPYKARLGTTMNNTNSNQPDFRSRLIAFLVILAVGFVMGYVNGRGQDSTKASEAPIVQEQQEDQQAERSEQTTSQQAVEDDQDFSLVDQYEEDDSSDYYEYDEQDDSGVTTVAPERGPTIEEDGWYTTKDEVALYIHTYGRLPGNYISKTKARDRGWVASKGNLDEVCPGMSIGAAASTTTMACCPTRRVATGLSATSTTTEGIAGQSESSSRTMGWSFIPAITTGPLSNCIRSTAHDRTDQDA